MKKKPANQLPLPAFPVLKPRVCSECADWLAGGMCLGEIKQAFDLAYPERFRIENPHYFPADREACEIAKPGLIDWERVK